MYLKGKWLSKAETLGTLHKNQKILEIHVPKNFYFTKKEYSKKKNTILEKIINFFPNKKIILRSSSKLEDKENFSGAGKYKSYSNLKSNSKHIDEKIKLILSDFKKNDDQVIVQEYIIKPDISGVIFTRNINNNSPYYYVNLDKSGRTDLVTSGKSNPTMKTLVFYRNFKKYKLENRYKKLFNSIQKIESFFLNHRLDIEFCIKNKKIIIFQCRVLKKAKNVNDLKVEEALINITKKIEKIKTKNPFIHGSDTFFSNMTDWNPAEMIGKTPSNLSISLYSELITDSVWAIQRKNYGYSDLTSNPLMLNFGGSPFIDLRVDFNSFIPKNINKKIHLKAINFYLNKIKNDQNLHDKIEFNLIETCYDINTKKNLNKFLSNKDTLIYSNSIRDLTNNILKNKNFFIDDELNKIKKLRKEIISIKKSRLSEIQKIYFYIKSCKNLGTLPFAGLARSAFIATKILRSLESNKLIMKEELENFYMSINSITNKINLELNNIKTKDDKKSFLLKYGHLRPSTYTITSKNYNENYNNYFSKNLNKKKSFKNKFIVNKKRKKNLDKLFKKHKLKITFDNFILFAKEAIKSREYAKFIFTISIDEIFKNLINLGKEIGIDRKNLEFISIKSILNSYNSVNISKLKIILKKEISDNKKNSSILNLLEFPDFISKKEDMYFHKLNNKKGNYVTSKITNGRLINYSKVKDFDLIENKIVLLQSADPGYDFIFSKNIKGLITEYGGSNSHMSIRCLELGIPAIIGIGTKEFNFLKKKKNIEINALQKFYRVLN